MFDKLEIRPDDIPGMSDEERGKFKASLEFMGRAIDNGLSQRGFLTKEEAEGLITRAIADQFRASNPQTQKDAEFAKHIEFCRDWFRMATQRNLGGIAELSGKNPDQFHPSVRATLTSGMTTGTNVMPALIYNDIIGYASSFIPIRNPGYCRILESDNKTGTFPVGASTRCTAYRRTEGSAATDSAPQIGGHTFTKMPLSVQLPVSNEFLNSWAVSVVRTWLVSEMGYAKAIKELTEFQTGTDSTQWDGIETNFTTAVTKPGSNLDIDYIRKQYYSLNWAFRTQAMWWAESTTINAIHGLIDGTGHFIFDQSKPLTELFGRPLWECSASTAGRVNFGWLFRYHIYTGPTAGFKVSDVGYTNVTQNQTLFFLDESNDAGPADDNAFNFSTISV